MQPCPAPFNLAAYVLSKGRHVPDKTALHVLSTGETWSYSKLIGAVRGIATGLLNAGLKEGDRVLLRLGNTADFPLSFLAAIAGGLIPIPTWAQLTAPEVEHLAARTKPAAVIAEAGMAVPEGRYVRLTPEDIQQFSTLPPAAYVLGPPDRPAYIIFTSGTTGTPRGVVHAHRAIWARRMMFDGWYGLGPEDRVLHAGSFNWTYTLGTGLMDPWTLGATALIPGPGATTATLAQLLAGHRATLFAAAPGVYRQMLRHPMPTLPDLRHGLSAGEKLPESLRQSWRAQTGTEIHEAFGMSECSTFLSGNPQHPAAPETMGRPQAGRSVRLIDGEIAIHREDPGLMLGYLDDPEATAARYKGEWFLTGDMAEDMGGDLRYLGRIDDMMNAGGFRVSPLEIEAALEAHPQVTDAAATEVHAAPDTTLIAVFYAGEASEAALRAHLQDRLARYKQPHIYQRLDTLPRNANNKLSRRTLRQTWEAKHGQT